MCMSFKMVLSRFIGGLRLGTVQGVRRNRRGRHLGWVAPAGPRRSGWFFGRFGMVRTVRIGSRRGRDTSRCVLRGPWRGRRVFSRGHGMVRDWRGSTVPARSCRSGGFFRRLRMVRAVRIGRRRLREAGRVINVRPWRRRVVSRGHRMI